MEIEVKVSKPTAVNGVNYVNVIVNFPSDYEMLYNNYKDKVVPFFAPNTPIIIYLSTDPVGSEQRVKERYPKAFAQDIIHLDSYAENKVPI